MTVNRGWSAPESALLLDLMRKAEFPVCASDKDFAGTANQSDCLNVLRNKSQSNMNTKPSAMNSLSFRRGDIWNVILWQLR
jgi:hypothetical protein